MSFDKLTKITAWSFSRYNTYKQCPLKAKLIYIDKLKEPASEPMERGSKIHDIAENYLTATGRRTVPKELTLFANLFRDLRKLQRDKFSKMIVEQMWCFKKDWSETHDKDWDNTWLRVKLDTAWFEFGELVVNDWKTGKFRVDSIGDYMEQLELYSLAALLKYPDTEIVNPRLSYLDSGHIYPEDTLYFTQKDVPMLKAIWEERTEPMLNDTEFAPRANQFCNWCHFRKDNGGPCKF